MHNGKQPKYNSRARILRTNFRVHHQLNLCYKIASKADFQNYLTWNLSLRAENTEKCIHIVLFECKIKNFQKMWKKAYQCSTLSCIGIDQRKNSNANSRYFSLILSIFFLRGIHKIIINRVEANFQLNAHRLTNENEAWLLSLANVN